MCLCASPVTPPDDQFLNLNYTQKGPSFLPKPPDCPPLVNAPICPITSVIHPKSKPGLCVTVPSYAPGVQVEVYVAYVNYSMIVEHNFICIANFAMRRTIRGSFLIKMCPTQSFEQQDPISAWMQVSIKLITYIAYNFYLLFKLLS